VRASARVGTLPRGGGPSVGSARYLAVTVLGRIEQGAYANLVLPAALDRSSLSERDRGFVTELVYGTTRMRRACDWLIDRFVMRPLDPEVRTVLRLGAYQLAFLRTPAHAAVSATVSCAPPRTRGLINAVLRRVAGAGPPDRDAWPDEGTRLSYPDWILDRLRADIGGRAATEALEAMNLAAPVTRRADGYVQDLASQWVAGMVGVGPGDRVADLCAAPGGKATAMARMGASVVAAVDHSASRVGLIRANVASLGLNNVVVVVGDGRHPPLPASQFDRALVDAPCSGLGVLRRRPDARWRVQATDLVDLISLQRALVSAAATLVRPGGTLMYSVCTLTRAETLDVDRWVAETYPSWLPVPAPGPPWQPAGCGALLLPQAAGTDGMFVTGWRRPGP
jgi:16S rRNA (cytosine967-C5)-methyltransferase